jgi:hypothetical protein
VYTYYRQGWISNKCFDGVIGASFGLLRCVCILRRCPSDFSLKACHPSSVAPGSRQIIHGQLLAGFHFLSLSRLLLRFSFALATHTPRMRPIHRYPTRPFFCATDFYISQVVWRALLTIIVKRRVFSSADTDKKERKKQIIISGISNDFHSCALWLFTGRK